MKYRIVTDVHADGTESIWIEWGARAYLGLFAGWQRVRGDPRPGPQYPFLIPRSPRKFNSYEEARGYIDLQLQQHRLNEAKKIIKTTYVEYP